MKPLDEPDAGALVFWRSGWWWRRAGVISVWQWLATGLGFAGTVVAARALGARGLGSVLLAEAVVALVAGFLDVTLDEAVLHHGSRSLEEDDPGRARELVKRSARLDLVVGVAVFVVIAVVVAPIATRLQPDIDGNLVRLAALGALVRTVDGTSLGVLLLIGRVDVWARSSVLTNALRLVGAVAAGQWGARALLASWVLAALAGSAAQASGAWVLGFRKWRANARESPPSRGVLLRFAMHTSIAGSVLAARSTIAPILLGARTGSTAVAQLAVAELPLMAAATATTPLRAVFIGEQSRLWARGRSDELLRSIVVYSVVGLGVGAVGAAAAWFLLPWMIETLYASEFEGAVTPARIMLVAAVAHLATGWSKSFAAAVGQPSMRTQVFAIELVVTVGVFFAFGARSASGAAGSVAAGSVAAAVSWWFLARRFLARARDDGPSCNQS